MGSFRVGWHSQFQYVESMLMPICWINVDEQLNQHCWAPYTNCASSQAVSYWNSWYEALCWKAPVLWSHLKGISGRHEPKKFACEFVNVWLLRPDVGQGLICFMTRCGVSEYIHMLTIRYGVTVCFALYIHITVCFVLGINIVLALLFESLDELQSEISSSALPLLLFQPNFSILHCIHFPFFLRGGGGGDGGGGEEQSKMWEEELDVRVINIVILNRLEAFPGW